MKGPAAGAEFLHQPILIPGARPLSSKIRIISGRDWSVRGIENCNCMAVCSVARKMCGFIESFV